MNVQKAYTIFSTGDLAAAERWYTKLLGRGPDYRPMPTYVQWDLFQHGGLALSTDTAVAGDTAGKGVAFMVVADLPAERRRLTDAGIALGDDMKGDYSTLAQVRDPDGNLVTLASPPTRPYPPA
jgi:catechol 2,3-dioxygenase-like lactoylglutathione lyase family enzyme